MTTHRARAQHCGRDAHLVTDTVTIEPSSHVLAYRLALRDSQQAQHGSTANGGASDPNDPPGLSVDLRDLGDVLIKDVGRRLEADGRWPAVVDASGRAGVFLKYADSNFAVALSPADMDPNRLRRSLLGALRYGKPFVVDMMDADMWDR